MLTSPACVPVLTAYTWACRGAINKNTKPKTSTDTNTKTKAIADTNTEDYYQRLGLRLILALHYGRVAQSRAML